MSAPSISQIAKAYQVTPERLRQISKAYGLDQQDLIKPELVFDRLLEAGRACPLRRRLADPVERAVIAEELNIAAMSGPRVPASTKIQSIH